MDPVTNRQLGKALFSASLLAVVVLLVAILPAEYNIDPTGLGKTLGLTALSEPASPAASSSPTLARHEIEITVPAGKGIEYKFHMAEYAKMEYQWLTDGPDLYFDLHGEPEGDTTGYFESYAIATVASMKGSFTTPFAGSHGWYWKNTSDQAVTVYLVASGTFEVTGLKQ